MEKKSIYLLVMYYKDSLAMSLCFFFKFHKGVFLKLAYNERKIYIKKKKEKQSHYRTGEALRVPGG